MPTTSSGKRHPLTARLPHKALTTDGRPLPVSAVSHSPGPAYLLPSEIGKGPKVSFKQRYVTDDELVPQPGPGEYEPKEVLRWSNAPSYSFGAKTSRDEKQDTLKDKPPPLHEVQAAEPGPGYYTNTVLDISKKPGVRTGWRVAQINSDDPKLLTHAGKSIGGPAASGRASRVPGPGHYTPRGDNKGRATIGTSEANASGTASMRPPAKNAEKRSDETAAPGPGAYDTTRFDLSKLALSKPTTMVARPFDVEQDDSPGPGSYETPTFTKSSRGPRFAPAPPPKPNRHNAPGPGEYCISRDLTPRGGGITIKHRTGPVPRPSRCPFQKGDVVAVQLRRTGAKVKATIRETWCCEDPSTPPSYTVVLESGAKRDVEGAQVSRWDSDVGPGAYDPAGGVGKAGPRHTIQGPCHFTSMAVSEARKTRDNPGPSEYFKDGHLPRSTGEGKKVKIGNRIDAKNQMIDVGPGGGPSGNYEPHHPSEFRPYDTFSPGVTLAGKARVKVTVIDDPNTVRRLCEEQGIIEWKGSKEWLVFRNSSASAPSGEVCKDDYCGAEGVFMQQGGVLRNKSSAAVTGPNREHNKSQPHAPWAAYSNKCRESIRVKFADGTTWNYPPAALTRHGLPFNKANERWPAPQTVRDGGPGSNDPVEPDTSPKISIGGRATELHTDLVPGPGQYELPPGMGGRGAVIGTGQ